MKRCCDASGENKFEKVILDMKSNSSKKRAYDLIINDIIRGEFQKDSVLNERKLIERYEIGKTPIREALVELCNEKVLRSIPRYGYEVLSLTQQDINDITQFRCILECACLRQTMQKLAPETLQGFKEYAAAEFRQLADADVWEAWESNVRVHLKLISYSGNQYCSEQLARSMGVLKRAYAQFYRTDVTETSRTFGPRALAHSATGSSTPVRRSALSTRQSMATLPMRPEKSPRRMRPSGN